MELIRIQVSCIHRKYSEQVYKNVRSLPFGIVTEIVNKIVRKPQWDTFLSWLLLPAYK